MELQVPWLRHERRHVGEVEVADGLLRSVARHPEWCNGPLTLLVRLHTHPLAVVEIERIEDPARDFPAFVEAAAGVAVRAHLAADGIPPPDGLDLWHGVGAVREPSCVSTRQTVVELAPSLSVVVATRNRTTELARCLDSILATEYPAFEVVVVDNDPTDTATRDLVRDRYPAAAVHYVREDQRGLAAAHNAGLAAAGGEIVAFTDDDVVVDRHWLAELVVPFVTHPNVGAATGLIMPAELDTPTQVLLDTHGGYAKGFVPTLRDLGENRPDDPLFPFAAGQLGSGANMAFSAEYLRDVGGFDPATGTGTLARGGDDLLAFFRLVMDGQTLAYRPGALVWHYHHRDPEAVRRQVYGYGVGLGAYLASAALHQPRAVLGMLRRIPAGIAYSRRSRDEGGQRPANWPEELARLERRGRLVGPAAYMASRASIWRRRMGQTPARQQR